MSDLAEPADEVPEISVSSILKYYTVVARLKHNSHQHYDVLVLQFAVNGNLSP